MVYGGTNVSSKRFKKGNSPMVRKASDHLFAYNYYLEIVIKENRKVILMKFLKGKRSSEIN